MKLRNVALVAGIGGFLYVHFRQGGELTLESFAATARGLLDRIGRETAAFRKEAERKAVHEVATTVADVTETSQ